MINKYTNKQRGLLAVIMAMVMVFAGAAFIADEADAVSPTDVAKIGETGYSTIQAAVDAASNGNTIVLLNDAVGPISVPSDKNITIDLNGFTISSVSVAHDNCTTSVITNKGTLTISDSSSAKTGKISLNSDGYLNGNQDSAINNIGTITLLGGSIERTGYAYYTIISTGKMTIEDGVSVKDVAGAVASKGWPSLVVVKEGELTINGGSFEGGLINVKNEEGAVVINGGTFTSNGIKGGNICNYNTMEINDGSFYGKDTTSYLVWNGTKTNGVGDLDINGGSFASDNEIALVKVETSNMGSIDVAEGVYDGKIVNIAAEVTGGTLNIGGSTNGFSQETVEGKNILTLNNYSGNQTFAGIDGVIIIGDNTITVQDDAVTSVLSGDIDYIKTVQGIGSLTIVLEGKVAGAAIDSNTLMTINGVTIDIKVSNTWEIGDNEGENAISAPAEVVGISSTNLTTMYSTITVDVDDTQGVSMGIDAGSALIMTKSALDVVANKNAIRASQMTIAGSSVQTTAEEVAIVGGLTITNESTVVAEAPVYGIKGSVSAAQDSTVTTSGMCITGTDSVNNAIITNNGDMIIERSASFRNLASFTNNGIIGVYGSFENAGGKTINNGEINTYGYDAGTNTSALSFTDGTNSATVTFSNVVALADGTFTLDVSVSGANTNATTLDGVMTRTSNSMTIYAVGEETSVSVKLTMGDTDKIAVIVTSESVNVNENAVDPTDINAIKGLIAYSIPQTISISGGELTNTGSMSIATAQDALVSTGGALINNGEMAVSGNITTTGGSISGNTIAIAAPTTVTLQGNVDIVFTYAGNYEIEVDGDDVTYTYDNEVKISGVAENVVVEAVDVPDNELDTTNFAGFKVKALVAAEDKEVTVTLIKGIVKATDNGSDPKSIFTTGAVLEILSGATFESVSSVTVGEGVLAVQDGAVLNIKGEAVESYSYGKLVYVMSFTKDDYTYYGSLTYALANASEGMTLVLNKIDGIAITDDLVIGKGITLQFAKGATLGIGTSEKIEVSMSEGAKFEFTDGANIINILGVVDLSGTFVYDGNEVVLSNIDVVANDFVKADAATKTVASDIGLKIANVLVDGTVTVQSGNVKVDASFSKDGTTSKSALVVSEGATLIGGTNAIGMLEGASVTIDGTYKPTTDVSIASDITGTGSIVLVESKKVTFTGANAYDISVSNGTDAVALSAVKVDAELILTSVAKSGNKAAYIDVSGTLKEGTALVTGNAGMSGLTVAEKAVVDVPAGSTITVLTASTATGLVKVAGTINMKVEGDSTTNSYGVLTYEITYTDGDYTIYTTVATAVKNAEAGDSFELENGLTLAGDAANPKGMEVPAGVTIVVPEGKKITLGAYAFLIIGDAPETLGATGGIQGTVEIADATAYVIAYASADMSQTKIVGSSDTVKIVDSQVSAINQLLATIYAIENNDVEFYGGSEFTVVAKTVQPDIEGYRFVEWQDTVGNKIPAEGVTSVKIGDMDFIAALKANMVQVTFTAVEGLTYYVNNLAQNTVGAPVYVEYGSTITAAPVVGYTGTALVNGQSYIVVDSETSVITGSGVTEKVTEIVTEDEGMELTDILLIVLVVLIVIMAIIVALRMMRS